MAGGSFNSLYRRITGGDIAPVYYLSGPEDILKQELIDRIAEATLDGDANEFNMDVRTAGDLDPESLIALVDTPPLLATRRVVVIKGTESWRKNARIWKWLHSYVENPAPGTVLILTHSGDGKLDSTLRSKCEHAAIGPLEPHRIEAWLTDRAGQMGLELDPDAAAHLVRVVGQELSVLSMELAKIAAASDGTINKTTVEELVGVRHGETLPDWVAAVIERRTSDAIEIMGSVLALSGVSGVRMVMALGTALIGTRLARAHIDSGAGTRQAISKVMDELRSSRPAGVGNWKTESETWVRAAGRWSGQELDAAIREALEADRALKSTTVTDEEGILMNLVLALGTIRQAA